MQSIHKKLLVLFIFIPHMIILSSKGITTVINNAKHHKSYLLCIDGGGSKTALQVVNQNGDIIPFSKNEKQLDVLITSCSNINTIGKKQFAHIINTLLQDIYIDEQPLAAIAYTCGIIGGFAGASTKDSQTFITEIFEQHNFQHSAIYINSDAEIVTHLIEKAGIILIAGTGSVCFGKKDTILTRVGGLGRLIGDEGSGYYLGIRAIRAALEDEFGYGTSTILTQKLKKHLNLQTIKDVIHPLHRGIIAPHTIASCAPYIFKYKDSDLIALRLFRKAVKKLSNLICTTIKKGSIPISDIYLIGGIFKNKYAHSFVDNIIHHAQLHAWNIVNCAYENPITYTAQTIIRRNK